jgi:PAS domain S-box-containing protein
MRERLLVVEDSPTQAERLRYLLERAGYDVMVAGSGEEALTELAVRPFALVLSDVLMPGIDGYELCRRIRAESVLRGVRVVLLTALSDPIDIIRGLECGADNYIAKPYDEEHLLARVRAALSARALHGEPRSSLGLTLSFFGTTFVINSGREQILDLFISSVEDVVRTKALLEESRQQLAAANEQLTRYAERMEHRAHVSTERLGMLMRHASDLILVLDSERRIVEANQRAAELLGRDPESLRGVALRELLVPGAGTEPALLWAALQVAGRIEREEIAFRDIHGWEVWCEFSAVAAFGEEEGLVLGIFRDITARRRAERKRALLAEIGEAMASSLDVNATLQTVASGAARLMGDFCVVDLIGPPPMRVAVAHADPERVAVAERARTFTIDPDHPVHPIARVLRTREPLLLERVDHAFLEAMAHSADHLVFLRDVLGMRSFLSVPLLGGGELLGALTISSASEERPLGEPELAAAREIARRAADALTNAVLYQRAQEARAQERAAKLQVTGILESIQDAFIALDREWRFSYLNPKALEMAARGFGLSVEELSGNVLWDRFPGLLDSPIGGALRDALAGQRTTSAEEYVEPLDAWLAIRAYPSTEGLSVYFQDVTAQKKAEIALLEADAALRESEALLRQSQKMEAVGQLAGGVAHDFNNVLTAIRCSTDFLLDELPVADRRREDVEEIRSATERAAALTRQLLAFSRQQVLQPRVLDARSVVEQVLRMLRRLIGEDIELRVEMPSSPQWVRIDPTQIEQVVLNLAVNARDAMPEGGVLGIRIREAVITAEASGPAGMAAGAYMVLSVSDTGVGIPPEVRERLFDPFFTTKGPDRGTGLGLATVYGIMEQSGGRIVVESELGAGSTFHLYLARSEEVDDASPVIVARGAVGGGSETILLVEDDPAVAALVRRALVESGYTVLSAQHGEEALFLCRAHPGEIHLLLSDVVMPRMSVLALASEFAARCPEMRALFISGHTYAEIGHRGVLESGVAFLRKPFSREELLATVAEVLQRDEPLSRILA